MDSRTPRERKLYGAAWNEVYGGYFADPEVAAPLVDSIACAAEEQEPTVIADLGGGTGFVLTQLGGRLGADSAVRLVCVDSAFEQLDDCPMPLDTLECPIEQLERWMLVEGDEGLLLCMRSVLHYFGEDGMRDRIAGFRQVLREGESLVHQNICFEDPVDQAPANYVYERMHTGKWYPTVAQLVSAFEDQGFEVLATQAAPSLSLTSGELEVRYDIEPSQMEDICLQTERQWGDGRAVFVRDDEGFSMSLDYKVMTCRAR